MRERRKLFVCLKMKRHRSQKIGAPFFHDSWVVQVFAYLCALARQCWLRCHGRSDITISHAALGRSQLCGHCGVSVRALSRCAHSMQENLPFFFPFPSLVTGKGSIFSFHIWSYGALPVSSSLLMPSKHPYFVWDLYFLECFFSQFCMIVGVASESALLKGTQPLKSQRLKRNYIGSRPLLLHRDVAGLFMIWAERIQLLMQMYPLKPTFKSKTVFYSLSFFQPTATSTPFEQWFHLVNWINSWQIRIYHLFSVVNF